jgi:hypothetical protein
MYALCPKCWNQLKTDQTNCPLCGTTAELSSSTYERQILAAIPRANPETRTQICRVLSSIGDKRAVQALIELLHDSDFFVRVAALRALGEIGDSSAITAVEKATLSQNLLVREVAAFVLKSLVRPGLRRADRQMSTRTPGSASV